MRNTTAPFPTKPKQKWTVYYPDGRIETRCGTRKGICREIGISYDAARKCDGIIANGKFAGFGLMKDEA
jgi:hypothetical protein